MIVAVEVMLAGGKLYLSPRRDQRSLPLDPHDDPLSAYVLLVNLHPDAV